jgi:hypothetical protein
MIKAILLIIGAAVYLETVQLGHTAAIAGLDHLQMLYTSAFTQAAAISSTSQDTLSNTGLSANIAK